MEAVIFIGIQGAGKSTFFKRNFSDTHIRLNGDMLKTKFREDILRRACFEAKQRFVVDKMNLTREQRAEYIAEAKKHHFRVVGYYFQADLKNALRRNDQREGKAKIPEKGITAAFAALQIPSREEGFDELFYVRINTTDEFVVENWKDEV